MRYDLPLIIAEPAPRMRVQMFSKITLGLVIALMAVLLASCSTARKQGRDELANLPVTEMYERGINALDNGNWGRATQTFERLISRFPFGEYTEQAQLDLAYTQYKANKPEDAYSTVNRFIRTYPAHNHIDYAYYLRGMINFDRSRGLIESWVGKDMSKRDQAYLRQSFDDFGALLTRYPNSRYAPDARQRMIHLRGTMAQSELHVAMFYLRNGAYVGAAVRAKHIVETYPQTSQTIDALAIMVRSYEQLGEAELAADARSVLELNYPQHELLTTGKWPPRRALYKRAIPLMNP